MIRQQHADAPHALWLLRPRSERPAGRAAAEQRDEVAPSQLVELHSIPSSQGRFEGYRMGRDRSAGLGALAACMLQRTFFQCPNFIY